MLRPVLESAEPPTAVLCCANGYVVAAAAKDLVALGNDVPADIALAGMDDAGPFDLLPLTTLSTSTHTHHSGFGNLRAVSSERSFRWRTAALSDATKRSHQSTSEPSASRDLF